MSDLQIRPASLEQFITAVDWAANEGWNPGLDDLAVFHATDPSGFLMGWKDGQPIASISVVNYSADYGFLGFYIVHPDHRSTGAGMAIWNAGMEYLGKRVIGLDGVLDQQENYKKSGFVFTGRNIRFTGVPKPWQNSTSTAMIRDIAHSDISALLAYDRKFFAANREIFTRRWINPDAEAQRQTKLAFLNDKLVGYATIRACRSGYKIGPLFADNPEIARALMAQICKSIPADSEVSLDVPEANCIGCAMADEFGLQPVFETARMYRGSPPPLPIAKTFGITTFELG